jgi:hypothetical protein
VSAEAGQIVADSAEVLPEICDLAPSTSRSDSDERRLRRWPPIRLIRDQRQGSFFGPRNAGPVSRKATALTNILARDTPARHGSTCCWSARPIMSDATPAARCA